MLEMFKKLIGDKKRVQNDDGTCCSIARGLSVCV